MKNQACRFRAIRDDHFAMFYGRLYNHLKNVYSFYQEIGNVDFVREGTRKYQQSVETKVILKFNNYINGPQSADFNLKQLLVEIVSNKVQVILTATNTKIHFD